MTSEGIPIIYATIPYPNHGFIHERTSVAMQKLQDCRDHLCLLSIHRGTAISQLRNLGINLGRSEAVEQKVNGFDYFLSVDSDVVFEVDHFKQLMAADKDIICAAYRYRGDPNRYVAGWYDHLGRIAPDSFATKAETGVQKVDFVGAGFLLVKCEAINRMTFPWFHEELVYYEEGGVKKVQYVGDDIGFCINATKNGLDIYCDFDCVIEHLVG